MLSGVIRLLLRHLQLQLTNNLQQQKIQLVTSIPFGQVKMDL